MKGAALPLKPAPAAPLHEWRAYRVSLVKLRIDGDAHVAALRAELDRIGTDAPKAVREPENSPSRKGLGRV